MTSSSVAQHLAANAALGVSSHFCCSVKSFTLSGQRQRSRSFGGTFGGGQRRWLAMKGIGRRFSGKSFWWQDRTNRFGHGFGDTQCILSFEIVTDIQMNQYLIGCTKSGTAALIDAGDAQASLETAKNFGFSIEMLLPTHTRKQHIKSLADIKSHILPKAKLHAHPAHVSWPKTEHDIRLLDESRMSLGGIPARSVGMLAQGWLQPDFELADGDTLMVGEIELRVMHTPGHSPGHVCYYCEDHGFLIAGDTLYRGTIARTDLLLGDRAAMRTTLQRILELPDSTKVFPAHMEPTTIAHERQSNAFIKEMHWNVG